MTVKTFCKNNLNLQMAISSSSNSVCGETVASEDNSFCFFKHEYHLVKLFSLLAHVLLIAIAQKSKSDQL